MARGADPTRRRILQVLILNPIWSIIYVMAKKPPTRGKAGKGRRGPHSLPNARAVLICEKVVKDVFTGMVTIVNVLTRFGITRFPAETPSFFVFAQLAHGMGKYGMMVEVQDDQKGVVIGRSPEMPLEFAYKTEVQDIIIQIPPVPLKHAGNYTVAVFVNGNEVGHQSFDTPEQGSTDASHPQQIR